MLKLKALQNVTGNLNLDDSNDEISETPLSLEEKIAKKWYHFELMEQFDYRNSLVEFFDQLSSTLVSSESSASFSSPSLSSTSPLPSSSPSNLDLDPISTTSLLKKSVSPSNNNLQVYLQKNRKAGFTPTKLSFEGHGKL